MSENKKRPRETLVDQSVGTIKFGDKYDSKDMRLFEVSDDILSIVLKGKGLRIIGENNDRAVLCTTDSTFSIKKVETSNLVFLIPSSDVESEFTIDSNCNHYYELSPTFPKVNQLNELLKPTLYKGQINDIENPPKVDLLLQLEDIMSKVQASEKELHTALTSIHALDINGHIRMLDRSVLYETYKDLIDTVIENAWCIESIPNSALTQNLATTDPTFLQYAVSMLGTRCEDTWSLDSSKAARAIAHILFQERALCNKQNVWPQDDFLFTWTNRTPGRVAPSESLLEGIALLILDDGSSTNTAGKSYLYLPLEDLSLDNKARFSQLFDAQPRYTLEQISPYLRDLVGRPGQPKNVVELLLVYSRLIDGYYVPKL